MPLDIENTRGRRRRARLAYFFGGIRNGNLRAVAVLHRIRDFGNEVWRGRSVGKARCAGAGNDNAPATLPGRANHEGRNMVPMVIGWSKP
jgi:hypothetical protein